MRNLQGDVQHKLGAWAWGLLGRCRDVGEMDSEDVGVLRGLGKKASALSRRLRAGESAAEVGVEEDEDGGEGNVNTGAAEEMGAGEAGPQTDINTEVSVEANTSLEEARKELLAVLGSGDTEKGGNARNGAVEQENGVDTTLEQMSDTHAMLDMVVTIVGECYGQRDLLDGRLAWEEI